MIIARKKGVDLLKYRRELSPADIKAAIKELTDSGVIDAVKKKASGLVADSNRLLMVLPASKERQLLMDVGEFFVTRSF
jgi:geranylgeranyl diphosphate synthase type I